MAARRGEEQEESIYNLRPRPQLAAPRPPMHRSAHPGEVDPAALGGPRPRAAATFGRPPGGNAEHPDAFLRSHAKEPLLPEPAAPAVRKPKVKPPVPGRAEAPLMGLASNKNYVTSNAVEAILASPKRRPQEAARYAERAGFGKVPAYLRRNRAAVAAEQQALEAYMRLHEQPAGQPAAVPMSEEERGELLRHLKMKWAAVNAEYQKLGFVMDIGSKVRRHEAMEAALAEIEADIATLGRGDVVLVVPGGGDE
ncbi:hypothetical protein HT031_005131 [Scenedesmus sp. PABB004]|nr:hypothetical protein HT031_005131 [Scenedesmus sp. PABB004]